MSRWTSIAALLGLVAGCEADPCAGAHDLLASPAGLELTEGEHRAGWGQTECFQCHQAFAIHRRECATDELVDVSELEDAVDVEDPSSCVPCHGDNGVAAWQDTGMTP